MSEDETRLSTGGSLEHLSPVVSPERLSSGASPERLSSGLSPERLSSDGPSGLLSSGAPPSNQELPSGVPIVVLTRMNIKVKDGSEDKKTTESITQNGIIPDQNTDQKGEKAWQATQKDVLHFRWIWPEIIEIDGFEEREAESDDNENSDVNIQNTTDSEEDDASKDVNRNRVDTRL
ncbi:hypothetical protein SNE40_013546 [Patella caerulea]